ncbi:hypothetical protein ACROYT_G008178 [Oculina patagonica]
MRSSGRTNIFQFSVMAFQKWTVFFASLVLVAFVVETKLTMASEEDIKTKTVCEFEKATISCLNGGKIKVVEASFGRHDHSTCSHSAIHTIECHAENSLSVMQSRCDQNPSCELYADTIVFGDPCPGTYKYLEVKFTCTEPPKSIAICETLKDTISCQDGKIIHVLQASYGRHDLVTCPHEYIFTTNCHAGNSHGIVEATCAYEPSCELHADNSVFGDPCPDTYKYLMVKYQCVEFTVICQNDKGAISCPDGKIIHLLQANIQISEGHVPVHLRGCS